MKNTPHATPGRHDNWRQKSTLVLLCIVLIIVAVYAAYHLDYVEFKQQNLYQSIMGALGAMFVIVLLVERVTETIIIIFRGEQEDLYKANIRYFVLTQDVDKQAEEEHALAQYSAQTNAIALVVGYTISIFVCASGIGLLQSLVENPDGVSEWFRISDTILTAGLLAGGSDVFHQFVSLIKDFFVNTKNRINRENLLIDSLPSRIPPPSNININVDRGTTSVDPKLPK